MSVLLKPPRDVDELARRLPRETPNVERMPAQRRALLDAARPQPGWWRGSPGRTWAIAVGGLAVAAACALIAWHTVGHPAVAPGLPSTPTIAGTTGLPRRGDLPPGPVVPPAPVGLPPTDARPAPAEAVVGAIEPAIELPDGETSFDASRPMQLTRGGATITAPSGARFDVDVQGDQVKRVAVKVGWVVIASSHAAATVVVERQLWTPPPPAAPAEPPPAMPGSPRPVGPGRAAPGPSVAAPARPAAPRATSPAASSERPSGSLPEPVVPARPPATPVAPAAGEQDFHDGLRVLLAGDARAAVAPLDRACHISSSTQDDICYWAAVASQRAGDPVRARDGFADVLARWPHTTHAGEANVALGWLLVDHGDRAGARARFAAAADDRMPSIRAEALRGLAAAR